MNSEVQAKPKIMLVFGTRPEAVKLCPLIKVLSARKFRPIVCVTGQHREMLDQVLRCFDVQPDYDLNIMREQQTLFDITRDILGGMKDVLEQEKPDMVLVQGDTSSTFAVGLACFYLKIPVGHVEAGLRTFDIYSPYPEEFNRQAVSLLACCHFAPTEAARQNLLREGRAADSIFVTGNTVIDALKTTVRADYSHPLLEWAAGQRLLLLTTHRRENLGRPLERILAAVKRVIDRHQDIRVLYPVHFNPAVRAAAGKVFSETERLKIVEPLSVFDFHNIMARSCLILSDSGGIQEEAPSLGKPVLVLRDRTERPEGVEAGALLLVGSREDNIVSAASRLLTDQTFYQQMSRASNPYGDGLAAERIVGHLLARLNNKEPAGPKKP